MKKEKKISNTVTCLTILLLAAFIAIPPVLRATMPKKEETKTEVGTTPITDETNQDLVNFNNGTLSCSIEDTAIGYTAKADILYVNATPDSNKIVFSVTDITKQAETLSQIAELNNLKAHEKLLYTTNEGSVTYKITAGNISEDNTLSEYLQNVASMKTNYEAKGYNCTLNSSGATTDNTAAGEVITPTETTE